MTTHSDGKTAYDAIREIERGPVTIEEAISFAREWSRVRTGVGGDVRFRIDEDGGRMAGYVRLLRGDLAGEKRVSESYEADRLEQRARILAAEARAKRLADALWEVQLHDGPGYPQGTCAKIARAALSQRKRHEWQMGRIL